MVYISIDSEFFEANKKSMVDEYKKKFDGDGYIYTDEVDGTLGEITDTNLKVRVENSKFGYVSVDVPLSTGDLLLLLELAVKKMNKFKTVLESLK